MLICRERHYAIKERNANLKPSTVHNDQKNCCWMIQTLAPVHRNLRNYEKKKLLEPFLRIVLRSLLPPISKILCTTEFNLFSFISSISNLLKDSHNLFEVLKKDLIWQILEVYIMYIYIIIS